MEWWMRFEEGNNVTATMTESEWLATTTDRQIFYVLNPPFRLEFLLIHLRQSLKVDKTKWGKRKLRLFACACCRRYWNQLNAANRSAVEFAERFADGQATKQERWDFWREIACPWNGRRFSLADFGQIVLEKSDWVAAIYMPAVSYSVFCVTPRYPHEWGEEAFQIARIIHDLFGNPFGSGTVDDSWLTPRVLSIAGTIYANHRFNDLPVLGDPLEEAGCGNTDILAHCHHTKLHVRGCWILDAILDKR